MGDDTTRRPGRGAHERVLLAARGLFATRGISSTTMEEVAAAAPVSKRTLYAHFASKDELVLAQLQALIGSGQVLDGALTSPDLSARDRLMTIFDVPAPEIGPVRGCPFVDAAAEFPDPDNPVHAFARAQKLRMLRLVTELLAEIGVADPEPLAEQLCTLSDGAASRAMVLDDQGYGRHARAAATALIDHALERARE